VDNWEGWKARGERNRKCGSLPSGKGTENGNAWKAGRKRIGKLGWLESGKGLENWESLEGEV
jgi:hypothetical protein